MINKKLQRRINKIEELTTEPNVPTDYHEQFQTTIDDMRKTFGIEKDDTGRISSDDIGNDIHEFLHGGDK
ncbi:hypothetical protein [Leuconostoc mesenteroides]|uniref:hypothetical protein n=1 Tax=Leuconostoc mesenteroides TaxID=1245 RepID=UPI00235FBE28|nr:hypothetical protein [Leuconostoc mesenteroides]